MLKMRENHPRKLAVNSIQWQNLPASQQGENKNNKSPRHAS